MRKKFKLYSVLNVYLALVLVSIVFAMGVDNILNRFNFPIYLKSLQNQSIVIFFIYIALYLHTKYKQKVLVVFAYTFAFFSAFFLFIDTFEYVLFSRRLMILDLFKFSLDFDVISVTMIMLLVIYFLLIVFLHDKFISKIKSSHYIGVTSLILILIPLPIVNHFKYKYLSNNFYQNNMNFDFAKQLDNLSNIENEYSNSFESIKGLNSKASIILVLAESWSLSDSKKYSQLSKDNLPQYDIVSDEGKTFTNMFAEGSTTDEAYVTLFNGIPPLQHNLDARAYKPYYLSNNLISFLNKQDYKTYFYKLHSLDFLEVRDYLQFLNFDKVGGKDELFNKEPFYSMSDMPDEALYNYALSEVKKQSSPFFMILTTISTHLSYCSPDGKTQKEAYNYADRTFYSFYNSLKQSGYLKDNYLIVIGDHRKMTALDKGEYEKYGKSAFARVVCTIFGGDIKKGVDTNFYNQSDLTNSLKYLTGKNIRLPKKFNNLFTSEIKRKFVIHDDFSDRNHIDIFGENNNSKEAKRYKDLIRGHYQFKDSQNIHI